jgi:hypothetical protein
MEEDDEDRGFITAKDFMNDFATEDFITKNIRVRPSSGIARETEADKKADDGFASRMGGDGEENEKKENEIVRMEMQHDREITKTRLAAYKARKVEEEEKLKKKRH